ncbi:hypothetical protein [Methylococcus geothermalis]|uniref:Uncharacterized protein n=1 Tax=Methylococcus geothermalis TaxID=2681310 RepID=A0A858Q9N8_9GAMM|nr:hypothetical protein [Methylococcus geothermalis]QJD30560.1 hypothetical protein GNH96_11615 [Methylococcus geothermalis]
MDLSVIAIAVGLLAYVLYAVYSSPAAGKAAASSPTSAAETAMPDEPPIPAQAVAAQEEIAAAEEPEPAAADTGETVMSLETEAAAEATAG